MTQPHTEHQDDDDDGDMVAVNVIDLRLQCLTIASNLEMPADDVLMVAESFVKFVLDGTTPAKRN